MSWLQCGRAPGYLVNDTQSKPWSCSDALRRLRIRGYFSLHQKACFLFVTPVIFHGQEASPAGLIRSISLGPLSSRSLPMIGSGHLVFS